MAKKPVQNKPGPKTSGKKNPGTKKPGIMFVWEISRLTGTPARVLGTVEAPDDQATAIQAGIEQFEITNPAQQARLSARKLRPVE